jgi:hypothetical protein
MYASLKRLRKLPKKPQKNKKCKTTPTKTDFFQLMRTHCRIAG